MQFESTTTAIIAIALGIAVLFLGKNLRFFAAAAGFLIGISFITALFPGQVLAGLILGVALAVLFVILLGIGKGFVQLIVRIIGALAAAAVAMWLLDSLGLNLGLLNWIIAIVAAVAGFVLMARFFDLGLIIITSLIGASLIVNGVQSLIPQISDGIATLATLALTVVGFFLQRRR
jgi:hypothetical protein